METVWLRLRPVGLALALVALLLAVRARTFARVLVPVAFLLTAATLLAAAWYAFGQDWALALLTNDSLGWWYTVVLGGVYAVLLDIAFLKGAVTETILNAVFEAFGSAFAFAPC